MTAVTRAVTVLPPPGRRVLEKFITLLVVCGPPAGVLVAAVRLLGGWMNTLDLMLFLGLWGVSLMGVSVGFHRLFTHQSFHAARPVQIGLALAGSLAVEGGLVSWVADHRRHHQFTDREGDPHSPVAAKGSWLRRIWHAHIGWFFVPERTDQSHYAQDIKDDATLKRISDLFPLWTVVSFLLPGVIGAVVTRSWDGTFSAFVWGGPVRVFVVHHLTWSINSITHTFGTRPFRTSDRSTNLWPLAVFTGGEAWHNNHHAFPRSARLGLKWWQPDPGWYLIRAMKVLRLVRNVRIPTADQMSKVMARRQPATLGT